MKRLLFLLTLFLPIVMQAQELQVKININHQQIQGTDKSVFDNLQETLHQFVNEKQWTAPQFRRTSAFSVRLISL